MSKDIASSSASEATALLDIAIDRRNTLFRQALALRFFIGITSFISLLPDSAYINISGKEFYPAMTTISGILAAIGVIFAKQVKLNERLRYYQRSIVILMRSIEKMIELDAISSQKELLSTKSDLENIASSLHEDLFAEHDKVQRIE